jgi:hypothetical protein
MQTATSKLASAIATLALLVGLVLPVSSQAQSAFDIGVRGGVTQATYYGDDVASNDFRPGFTGGVFLTYQVNEAFSIQPEVLYSLRGAKDHFNEAGTLNDVRVSQDVIEIPVLFKLSAPLSPITPRIFAGPSIGFITNTSVNGVDADDAFNDVDFGGVLGGEIAYQIGAGPLSEVALDGRYNVGFVDLGDLETFESVSNSAFTGTMSLRFNI